MLCALSCCLSFAVSIFCAVAVAVDVAHKSILTIIMLLMLQIFLNRIWQQEPRRISKQRQSNDRMEYGTTKQSNFQASNSNAAINSNHERKEHF